MCVTCGGFCRRLWGACKKAAASYHPPPPHTSSCTKVATRVSCCPQHATLGQPSAAAAADVAVRASYESSACMCAGTTAAPCAMVWAVLTTSTAAPMMPPSVTQTRVCAPLRMARSRCHGPQRCRPHTLLLLLLLTHPTTLMLVLLLTAAVVGLFGGHAAAACTLAGRTVLSRKDDRLLFETVPLMLMMIVVV